MKKIILVLGALLLLILPVAAAEADVVYDGKDVVVKDGASSTVNEKIEGLFPGQTVEFDVTFANNSANKTAWYISNEIIESLESGEAKNGGYTYELNYVAPDGSTTPLYNDSTIGGDETEGLKEANEQLEDYRYLDTLAPGASASVRITLGLDGESQPNAYMNKLGELALRFAVEDQVEQRVRIVKTAAGSENETVTYSYGMIAALGVSIFCFLYLLLQRKGGKRHA